MTDPFAVKFYFIPNFGLNNFVTCEHSFCLKCIISHECCVILLQQTASDYVLSILTRINLFSIPVVFMEGLADGTIVVCFQIDEKRNDAETAEKKEYVLTQYNGKQTLLETKLANRPSGMTEVTVGLKICLALSYR